MIEKINLNNILFWIETVPEYHNYRGLDHETQQLWEQKLNTKEKMKFLVKIFMSVLEFVMNLEKSSEFVGYFVNKADIRNFRVTSFGVMKKKYYKIFQIY